MDRHYEVSIEVNGERVDIAQVHHDLEAQQMVMNIAQSFKPEMRSCNCDLLLV